MVTSWLVADTHCHVYSSYRVSTFFAAAWRNLYSKADPQKGSASLFLPALFLAERSDCHFFADLASGRQNDPAYRVEPTAEKEALRITLAAAPEMGARTLYLFSGRQIRTSERLEVLSLLASVDIAEGLSLGETCALVQSSGGMPVITWAAGKWTGRRAQLVRNFIEKPPSYRFSIGDSSLRCAGMPGGRILAASTQKGIPVLAGSDPLPFAGEERRVGSYGISGQLQFDPEKPVSSVRQFLANGRWQFVGRRDDPVTAAWRLISAKLAGSSATA